MSTKSSAYWHPIHFLEISRIAEPTHCVHLFLAILILIIFTFAASKEKLTQSVDLRDSMAVKDL